LPPNGSLLQLVNRQLHASVGHDGGRKKAGNFETAALAPQFAVVSSPHPIAAPAKRPSGVAVTPTMKLSLQRAIFTGFRA
jgi:hypothetical protein